MKQARVSNSTVEVRFRKHVDREDGLTMRRRCRRKIDVERGAKSGFSL